MTNLLTQSVAFISLGFDAEAEENVEINDPQLKTLISQIRTNLSNKQGGKNGNIYMRSIDSSLVPSQEEFATLNVSEIASFHLTHRHAPVCIAAAVELERRLKDDTQSEKVAGQLRQARAFRILISLLRHDSEDVQIAAAKVLVAAVSTSSATRERLRYIGTISILLVKCDLELNKDDRLRLACLRVLLALIKDSKPRAAFVKSDGVRRCGKLFGETVPAPIQLLAVAACAQATTVHDTGTDPFGHAFNADLVADTVVLCVQRASDTRIIKHCRQFLLNMSRSHTVARAVVGHVRSERALQAYFEKFLDISKFKETEHVRVVLDTLCGFASHESLASVLAPCVAPVKQLLLPSNDSTVAAAVSVAALAVLRAFALDDTTRADVVSMRAWLGDTVASAEQRPASVVVAAISVLDALWQLHGVDAHTAPREVKALVAFVAQADVEQSVVAVSCLESMVAASETMILPLLKFHAVEALQSTLSKATHKPAQLAAARALRAFTRYASGRQTLEAAFNSLALFTDQLTDFDGSDESEKLETILVQLVTEMARHSAELTQSVLDDGSALINIVARLCSPSSPLRRSILVLLAVLIRQNHSSATKLLQYGVVDNLLKIAAGIDVVGSKTVVVGYAAERSRAQASSGRCVPDTRQRQAALGILAQLPLSALQQDGNVSTVLAFIAKESSSSQLGALASSLLKTISSGSSTTNNHSSNTSSSSSSSLSSSSLSSSITTPITNKTSVDVEQDLVLPAIHPTIVKILNSMSKEQLIALLNVTSTVGNVDLQDALVLWRRQLNAANKQQQSIQDLQPQQQLQQPQQQQPSSDADDNSDSEEAPLPASKSPLAIAAANNNVEDDDDDDSSSDSDSSQSDNDSPQQELAELNSLSIESFDEASVDFQNLLMRLELADALETGNGLLEISTTIAHELGLESIEFDSCCENLVASINSTFADATALLDDPEDNDCIAAFSQSFESMQQDILAVRQQLITAGASVDNNIDTPTPPPMPGGTGVHGFNANNFKRAKLRSQGNLQGALLTELAAAVKGGVVLKKTVPGEQQPALREATLTDRLFGDLKDRVKKRESVARETLIDKDVLRGREIFRRDVALWLSLLQSHLQSHHTYVALLLRLCESQSALIRWRDALKLLRFGALKQSNGADDSVDEPTLVNVLRDVGFAVHRSTFSVAGQSRIRFDAIERPATFPLTMLARALVVFTRPLTELKHTARTSARKTLLDAYDDDIVDTANANTASAAETAPSDKLLTTANRNSGWGVRPNRSRARGATIDIGSSSSATSTTTTITTTAADNNDASKSNSKFTWRGSLRRRPKDSSGSAPAADAPIRASSLGKHRK